MLIFNRNATIKLTFCRIFSLFRKKVRSDPRKPKFQIDGLHIFVFPEKHIQAQNVPVDVLQYVSSF